MLQIYIERIQERDIDVDQKAINCCMFYNSMLVSKFDAPDSQKHVSIMMSSLDEEILLVFYEKSSLKKLGTINLKPKEIIQQKEKNSAQWFTLCNQPQDMNGQSYDSFYQVLINCHHSEDKNILNLNKTTTDLKEFLQERDLNENDFKKKYATVDQNDNFLASLASHKDFETNLKVSREQTLFHRSSLKDLLLKSMNKLEHLPIDLSEIKGSFLHEKINSHRDDDPTDHSIEVLISEKIGDQESELLPTMSTLRGNSRTSMEILKKNFEQDISVLTKKLQQASDLEKNVKELKASLGIKAPENIDITITTTASDLGIRKHVLVLEQRNCELIEKINEFKEMNDRLKRENNLLKQNEEIYSSKFQDLKTELEKLRFTKETYEAIIGETEHQFNQTKVQLKMETNTKNQILQEKEEISLSLRETLKSFDALRQSVTQVKQKLPEEIHHLAFSMEGIERPFQNIKDINAKFDNHIDVYSQRAVLLENENTSLQQEVKSLKTQFNLDATLIQNLQKEVFALRQKEVELRATIMTLKHTKSGENIACTKETLQHFMNKCSQAISTNINVDNFEDFSQQVQTQIVSMKKEIEIFKVLNEDLNTKLSLSDNKLLADSLVDQISGLKSQVELLETEKENMRVELFQANENYMNLTNKYTELTDTLAALKKSDVKGNQTTSMTKLPISSFSKVEDVKANYASQVDEIEKKLNDFLTTHHIRTSLFSKLDKGKYTCDGKIVFLKLLNDQLIIKAGDEYKSLYEFAKKKNYIRHMTKSASSLDKSKSMERKSVDSKAKFEKGVLQGNESCIDLSLTARSTVKDSARSSFSHSSCRKSVASHFHKSPLKTRPDLKENMKLREILFSRSMERKFSSQTIATKAKMPF